jgi:hypothetical protein
VTPSTSSLKLLFALSQRFLDLDLLADVAGDLRIADEVAVDANGIDHHMGEKPGAILAQAPAAILEFSLGRGRCAVPDPANRWRDPPRCKSS